MGYRWDLTKAEGRRARKELGEFLSAELKTNFPKWYLAHEGRLVLGVTIFLIAAWTLFFAVPHHRQAFPLIEVLLWVVTFFLYFGALLLAVILRASTGRLFFWVIAGLLVFVLAFTQIYWRIGTSSDFTVPLSHLDALYFAVGTVSTAGTGNIYAMSQLARGTQTAEMLLGMVLILVLLAAVVGRLAGGRNRDRGSAREVIPTSSTPLVPTAAPAARRQRGARQEPNP